MDIGSLVEGLGGGGVVGGVIAYFTLASKSRKYIRESMGKNDELDVHIRKQPIEVKASVSYAEKDETEERFSEMKDNIDGVEAHFDSTIATIRQETKSDLDRMRYEATEGRRAIHQEIKTGNNSIGDKILTLTNSVGELRGEIRGMKK